MVSNIRSATAADIDQLVALEFGTYADEGYPAPLFYQALAQWSPWLFIAERDNAVVGYVLAAPGSGSSLWIMSLLVANSARGEGIGRQLMQTLLAQVHTQPNPFSKIALTVSPNNFGAIHLYRQLGFKDIEQIDNFMGPNQHRLLMHYNAC
ncbi:GNAT family N-acetyltransferase [Pseudidiomarina andamanensis]|uniref:N-acetyltransferase n=1 Tax=Pseudidiomarina andamanensis TaxID=1940690 RepID=A0AA92EVD4_9GAMM|nr:N-acetyltransferase [Pseudidiomarina andamanensis]MDS0218503.1 GNAT family N-acetyltransferase [Pseudidiomarina andamanensis]QGT95379.1 N-acetyltransferase [Pseudidiomarina andamanensis]